MESPLIALFQLIDAFKMLGIDYVVVGSLASSLHGDYRASADIDVVAQVSPKHILAKLCWFRTGEEVSELQWRDVKGILATQGSRLDLDYLRSWAERVAVSDLLERAMKEIE